MTTAKIKEAVRRRQGCRCADCGKKPEGYFETLEVHRLILGSAYSLEGCVGLCRRCHCRRHRKDGTWGKMRHPKSMPMALAVDPDEVEMIVTEQGNVRLSVTPRGVAVIVGGGYVIYQGWDKILEAKKRAERTLEQVKTSRKPSGRPRKDMAAV